MKLGRDDVQNLPFDGLHAFRIGVIFMIMTNQMHDSMDQKAGYFLCFAILPHAFMHDVEGDHDIPQNQGILLRSLSVTLHFGGLCGGKGEHVRGTVLLSPLPVQVLDEGIVTEDQRQFTFFQAEVGQDAGCYLFCRRCPRRPGQPRRTMSYGE